MKFSQHLLTVCSAFVLFTGCENPVSSVDGNSDSNGNTTTTKEYSCKIDKIVITSLNTADWDAFGGYGDPKFAIKYNGTSLITTSAKSDMAPYHFPTTYTIDKTISNPFEGKLEVKLVDQDVSEDDEKCSVVIDLNGYKKSSTISFDLDDYDLVSTIYLSWIEK